MDSNRVEAIRQELGQLLRKQSAVLQSRTFGAATDADILEYEIRQEIISRNVQSTRQFGRDSVKDSGEQQTITVWAWTPVSRQRVADWRDGIASITLENHRFAAEARHTQADRAARESRRLRLIESR
jgi:hypothetical protein